MELDDPTGAAYMSRGMVLLARGKHDAALEASESAGCTNRSIRQITVEFDYT